MTEDDAGEYLVTDGALLGLLVLDGVLAGAFGLVVTPLYVGGVPVPMGAILATLIVPWLVLRAGEMDARPGVAGAPLTAWVLTVGVLGLGGPGGDAMLSLAPATWWMSLLLVAGGAGAGLLALRRVLLTGHLHGGRRRRGADRR